MNPPKKVRTYRDALIRSQQSSFVGREKQRFRFRHSVELAIKDELDRPIFNVSGLGGVGKSTLLRQFRQITQDLGGATAYIDETEKSVTEVMGRFAEELEQQGHKLAQFSERYKVYRQRRQELESDPEAPQGLSALLGRSAVKLARRVPGAGVAFDFVDEEAVAELAEEGFSFIAKKLTNKDEVRLVQEPLEILTPLFLQDIGKLAEKLAVALFFDTYERTGEFLDRWLQDLINSRYGDLPMRVLLVIAGREELDKNQWAPYEGLIVRFPLEPFTDAEARQYLAQKGITEDDVIDIILRLSGHLPLLVATLAIEIPDDPEQVGEPSDTAVERFLKWVDDLKRRQVALDAALPQCLNRDILVLLHGDADAEALFEWLKQMPFVEERQDGWVYHEVVKTQMLRHKRRSSPQQWAALHGKLADYYDTLRNALQLDEAEQYKDADWQRYRLNVLYHCLCQAPQANLPIALNEFLAALKHQRTFAQRWAETMAAAGRDADTSEVQQWGEQLIAVLRAIDEKLYDVGINTITQLLNYPNLEAKWRPTALFQCGLLHFRAKQYPQALENLTEAGKIAPEESKHWGLRGETYRLMGRYEEALNDFNHAIDLNRNATLAITGRGIIYQEMKRYEEALEDFNQAIKSDPKLKWAIARRGKAYQEIGCYEEALKDFDRAIELDSNYAWAIAYRGEAYRLMEQYDEAIEDFDRAIELDPNDAWAIASRGQTHLRIACYDEALKDFDRAIEELNFEYAWVIADRGETYRLMERYDEALEDFDRAIELSPDYAWAIASRGQTYQEMERYDEALEDFDRAIELSPDYDWVINKRGALYLALQRYDAALTDFDRAIALDPNYARAIANRGGSYYLMQRYDEALDDLTCAIELNPKLAWAIAVRGATYYFMKRYEEALDDFTRAIELYPNYDWAIARRGEIYLMLKRSNEALADFNRAIELDADDWNLYDRALAYYVLNQMDEAKADLDCAAQLAQQRYEKDAADWNNTFNLALYYLVAGETEQSKHFYREALNRNVPLERICAALRDLDYLLTIFPNHQQAKLFRDALQKQLEARSNST